MLVESVCIAVHQIVARSISHLCTNTNLHPHILSHLLHIHVEVELVEVVEVVEVVVHPSILTYMLHSSAIVLGHLNLHNQHVKHKI